MGQRMGIYFFNLAEHPRKAHIKKKLETHYIS